MLVEVSELRIFKHLVEVPDGTPIESIDINTMRILGTDFNCDYDGTHYEFLGVSTNTSHDINGNILEELRC